MNNILGFLVFKSYVRSYMYIDKNIIKYIYQMVVTHNNIIEKIKNNPEYLSNVVQSEILCKNAILINHKTFKYIHHKTQQLCKFAVSINGKLLKYCPNISPDVCITALSENGMALKYVHDQTPELCIIAVSNNGNAVKYSKYKSFNIYKRAIINNPHSVKFIDNQFDELYKLAVTMDPKSVLVIDNPSYNLLSYALFLDYNILKSKNVYINDDLCFESIKRHPLTSCSILSNVKTQEFYIKAFNISPYFYVHLTNPTFEQSIIAIEKITYNFRYVKKKALFVLLLILYRKWRILSKLFKYLLFWIGPYFNIMVGLIYFCIALYY